MLEAGLDCQVTTMEASPPLDSCPSPNGLGFASLLPRSVKSWAKDGRQQVRVRNRQTHEALRSHVLGTLVYDPPKRPPGCASPKRLWPQSSEQKTSVRGFIGAWESFRLSLLLYLNTPFKRYKRYNTL